MTAASCRHCGRSIKWVAVASTDKRTGTSKTSPIPVDAEPSEMGNVYVEVQDHHRLVGRVRGKGAPRPPGVAHVPHFATCPTLLKSRPAAAPKKPKAAPPEPPLTLFGDDT